MVRTLTLFAVAVNQELLQALVKRRPAQELGYAAPRRFALWKSRAYRANTQQADFEVPSSVRCELANLNVLQKR